jgi:hypothetical protein
MEEPFTGRGPAAGEARTRIDLRVCRGETTSFLLGLHALTAHSGLMWSLTGPMPSGARVEFLRVVMAPLAHRRSDKYSTIGLWLADGGAVDVEAGRSRAWLVRIGIGPNVGPGNYSLPLPSLASKAGRSIQAGPRIGIRVLPFALADPRERGYVFGAFCGGPTSARRSTAR